VRPPDDVSRRRTWVPVVFAAVLPWTWFALRGLHPRLETVAVLLPLCIFGGLLATVIVAAALRRPRVLVVTASLAIFGVVTIVGPRLPHPGPAPLEPLRLASANVFSENAAADAAVHALMAQGADVEVAVETSPAFRLALDVLDTAHPYVAIDDQLVLRSRFPVELLDDPPNVPARRILRASIDGPGGPFVLYAVHALNPLSESTFAQQLAWVRHLRVAAARETAPVVIAGDFNMSDRQVGYRELAGTLRDAITASGWGRTTYPNGIWAPLLLRIDHVFESRSWCAAGGARFDVPGSDHDGIAVSIGPCP
jgi:endonuclease/exonuclease/phosphatase (EEP) superfamily protein YafD